MSSLIELKLEYALRNILGPSLVELQLWFVVTVIPIFLVWTTISMFLDSLPEIKRRTRIWMREKSGSGLHRAAKLPPLFEGQNRYKYPFGILDWEGRRRRGVFPKNACFEKDHMEQKLRQFIEQLKLAHEMCLYPQGVTSEVSTFDGNGTRILLHLNGTPLLEIREARSEKSEYASRIQELGSGPINRVEITLAA